MSKSMQERPEVDRGERSAAPRLSQPAQASFKMPLPPVLPFLENLIGARRLEVATRLYPKLSAASAEKALERKLKGRGKHKIGVEQLDVILDVLGPEAEEAWFAFTNRRRGWRAPEREIPEEALRDSIESLVRRMAEREKDDAALREDVKRLLQAVPR